VNAYCVLAAGAVVVAACGAGDPPGTAVRLPPAGTELDYQLGTAYGFPSATAGIVVRDRTAEPDAGQYSICYLNAFQTQPGEAAAWIEEHPELVLRDGSGTLVVDPEWPDEMILDIGTGANRSALAAIVGGWIDGCAADGFDAVEIDNLDTSARFPGLVDSDDAIAYAALLTGRAHTVGLAIGQKNAAELVPERARTGFDFAVVEQCNEFDECDAFVDGYGEHVLVIEYDERAFEAGCERYPELSIVLRDLDLVGPDDPAYVRRTCGS
jgi:hypothetical protein